MLAMGATECRAALDPVVAVASTPLGGISAWVMEHTRVERHYGHEDLHRLATELDLLPDGWSPTEVADFHVLDQCARAARVDTDLRNMRMLRIGPHPVGEPNRACATLTSGRVLDLTFKNTDGDWAVAFDLHDRAEG